MKLSRSNRLPGQIQRGIRVGSIHLIFSKYIIDEICLISLVELVRFWSYQFFFFEKVRVSYPVSSSHFRIALNEKEKKNYDNRLGCCIQLSREHVVPMSMTRMRTRTFIQISDHFSFVRCSHSTWMAGYHAESTVKHPEHTSRTPLLMPLVSVSERTMPRQLNKLDLN